MRARGEEEEISDTTAKEKNRENHDGSELQHKASTQFI